MNSILQNIERFLCNLMAAYGWIAKRDTIQFWSDRLLKFDLTEDQWARALSRIVSNEETRPSLAQIYPYLRSQAFKQGAELVPVWETFQDAAGKCWASKTGKYTTSVPTWEELKVWERDKASQDEGRECFRRGYLEAGGKPVDLGKYWSAIIAKPEPPRKPLWYQDIPDESELPI